MEVLIDNQESQKKKSQKSQKSQKRIGDWEKNSKDIVKNLKGGENILYNDKINYKILKKDEEKSILYVINNKKEINKIKGDKLLKVKKI